MILWGFTPVESEPYMEYQYRQILFREAIIGFLVPKEEDKGHTETIYCTACKKAKPGLDCSKCDKSQIKVRK